MNRDGGCMPLGCINCLLFYNTSAGLKISISKLRELFPDLAPLVLLQPSYRFVFMLLKRHFTFPLCAVTSYKEIAYQCLHLEREKRPTTREVLVELKKALEFQVS
ncbi:hypothetical protein HanXRQr2_Chr01g0027321 [Helianthus annuus]|uniref:Serine-threonine/tyrosine-protein kinase catalytic domain-containing protein n=1 Tax=Helianthus annuus TaxID=4232 RepID=A0A9K3JXG0_HELAN|nr:hypothetical protein HanXRQr2_Chr01g0027321 [Helianthus annuus]KAJ0708414.1 hypothetical protein HanLR1_Chr09g0329151 [Helianthus annuus]